MRKGKGRKDSRRNASFVLCFHHLCCPITQDAARVKELLAEIAELEAKVEAKVEAQVPSVAPVVLFSEELHVK